MTEKEFAQFVVSVRERQDELLRRKGADYTRGDADRLSNFKRVAKAVGLTSLQVWYVYASKHWDAISVYVKTGRVESEGIAGRFDDLANYLMLGLALLAEPEEEERHAS